MPVASAIIRGGETPETAAVIKSTLAAEQLTTLVRRVSLPSGATRPRPEVVARFLAKDCRHYGTSLQAAVLDG
jgi:hypothetical protein